MQVQLRVVPLDKAGRQEAWVPEFLFTVEKITGDEVSAGLAVRQSASLPRLAAPDRVCPGGGGQVVEGDGQPRTAGVSGDRIGKLNQDDIKSFQPLLLLLGGILTHE